jgi:hypothetical protein
MSDDQADQQHEEEKKEYASKEEKPAATKASMSSLYHRTRILKDGDSFATLYEWFRHMPLSQHRLLKDVIHSGI